MTPTYPPNKPEGEWKGGDPWVAGGTVWPDWMEVDLKAGWDGSGPGQRAPELTIQRPVRSSPAPPPQIPSTFFPW